MSKCSSIFIRWGKLVAHIFRMALERCTFTATSLNPSSAAICFVLADVCRKLWKLFCEWHSLVSAQNCSVLFSGPSFPRSFHEHKTDGEAKEMPANAFRDRPVRPTPGTSPSLRTQRLAGDGRKHKPGIAARLPPARCGVTTHPLRSFDTPKRDRS